jgi:hypothetical protein
MGSRGLSPADPAALPPGAPSQRQVRVDEPLDLPGWEGPRLDQPADVAQNILPRGARPGRVDPAQDSLGVRWEELEPIPREPIDGSVPARHAHNLPWGRELLALGPKRVPQVVTFNVTVRAG